MGNIPETYDVPRKISPTLKFVAFMLAFAVGAPLLWLVLPDGIVTVAVMGILLLVIIGVALRAILASRDVQQPPPRRPVPTRPD
jgi:hypothetical protein